MTQSSELNGRSKVKSDVGRYAMVPLWLIERVSPRALALFALMAAEYADRDGVAWPGRRKLAERLAISVPTLDKAMAELVAVDAVEKAVRKSDEGGNLTNLYTVHYGDPSVRGGGQADVTRGAKPVLPEPEPVTQRTDTSNEVSAPSVPKAVRIDGRDLPFDAVAEVCGIRAGSPRARAIPKSLNGDDGIRAQAWAEAEFRLARFQDPEVFEHWLSERIHERAAAYRAAMPGAALTPTALAKWWTDLPGMAPARDGRSGSGAEVVDAVDAAVRRERERSQ